MHIFYASIAGIESINLSGEMTLFAIRYSNQPNPGMHGAVFQGDFIGSVSRSVTDNYPPRGPVRLNEDAFDGSFNALGFVPRRRN
jgi:hypothetical protein